MRCLTLSLTLVFCSFCSAALLAQGDGTIFLNNPSFEDMARHSATPTGWTDCGVPGESAPDIHPDPSREFMVSKTAQEGNTYLGMVVRDVDTWEKVGQMLSVPFAAEQCYEMRIQLARSSQYMSASRKTRRLENYVRPITLRIRGGYSICDPGRVIGTSELISNYEWQEYRIKLSPQEAYTHIILEAFYETPVMFPYNGNVIVDNASPIVPIACDKDLTEPDEPLLVVNDDNPVNDIQTTPVPAPRRVPKSPVIADTRRPAPPAEPKVKLGTTEAVLKEGQVFAIDKISFVANSAELEQESEAALLEIAGFLRDNDNVIVEIGGHASRMASKTFANDLSQERADQVVSYLRQQNIAFNRMMPQGYGNMRPVCTDDTPECNQRNQRVEVKILKLKSK